MYVQKQSIVVFWGRNNNEAEGPTAVTDFLFICKGRLQSLIEGTHHGPFILVTRPDAQRGITFPSSDDGENC